MATIAPNIREIDPEPFCEFAGKALARRAPRDGFRNNHSRFEIRCQPGRSQLFLSAKTLPAHMDFVGGSLLLRRQLYVAPKRREIFAQGKAQSRRNGRW
ncbi:MAG: hypothetical protein GX592_03735 [Clostridiales bacterium]|nr:hypothetical protein [Clostridiales bacterium]